MQRFNWTKEAIKRLRYYKQKGYPNRRIANIFRVTDASITNACTIYTAHLPENIKKQRLKEANIKAYETKIKNGSIFEWTSKRLKLLREYKKRGLTDKQIAEKFGIKLSTVSHACCKNGFLLDESTRKRRFSEAAHISYLLNKPKREKAAEITNFDEDLGYIIGVLYGDGSAVIRKQKSCFLELRTVNKSFADAFCDAIQKSFKLEPKRYLHTYTKTIARENRTYKNVRFHEVFIYRSYLVKNIISLFGKTTTKDWRIDLQQCIKFGLPFCKGLIRGLFDSDGSFYIQNRNGRLRGHLRFSSTNNQGALSLINLLKLLGFDFRIYHTHKKYEVIEYMVQTSNTLIVKKFYEEIGFSIDYKQQRLKNFIESKFTSTPSHTI